MSAPAPSTVSSARAGGAQRLVLRNASFLVGAQLLAAPLSVLINVVAARSLGPDDFGRIFLATTYASFAILFVEWGQGATLTAMIARDRSRAGAVLGTTLAWRAAVLPVVAAALFAACWLLGYDAQFLRILAVVMLAAAFATIGAACQDLFRGYERADLGAASYLAWQLLTAAVLVPTLLLGGGLQSFLLAQAACAGIGAAALLSLRTVVGAPRLTVRADVMRALVSGGTAFLVFNIVLALQTNVDAVFLSRLASADAIGWNAAARKLIGVLIFPANALIGALYPTLCRLHGGDSASFGATARTALRVTLWGAAPLALGCALFPAVGIALFGAQRYGPAEDNLRVLALYVLLVYCTMPIGSSLAAAGRQRAWALAQFACVVVSAALDPLLIPWFQDRTGNGGLGVCVATDVSEVLMVAAGIALLPRGVLDRTLWRTLAAVAAAAAAMAALGALLLSVLDWPPLAAAVPAVLAYLGVLWATGEIDRARLAALRGLLARQ